jgi:nucleotide-binding universal stress UspA family protein
VKIADYVSEDEEQIVAATDLVTRELKNKKAEDAAALAKIRELAKEIGVPVSSIAREDAGVGAQ